jgi:hypothetical protein
MLSEQFIDELKRSIGDYVLRQIDTRLAPAWPRWMTIKTAAKYIDHSDRSFEYLLSKNLFPVVRRDRLVLIDRDDLDRVLSRLKR